MSIRWGTSSGFSRREKLLLVTGTALTRANSATPQLVERGKPAREVRAAALKRRATVKSITRKYSRARGTGPRPHTQLKVPAGKVPASASGDELLQLDLAAG